MKTDDEMREYIKELVHDELIRIKRRKIAIISFIILCALITTVVILVLI